MKMGSERLEVFTVVVGRLKNPGFHSPVVVKERKGVKNVG